MKPLGKLLRFREVRSTSVVGVTAAAIIRTEELILRVKTPRKRRYKKPLNAMPF
jgi:hypothetical protein